MIKLRWNDKWLPFESVSWSGTDNQASREITFTLPSNPYDKSVKKYGIKLGDIVKMKSSSKDAKKWLFVGVVTSRNRTAEVGTVSYTARDFMHYLLKSNTTRKFKDTTPEAITKSICKEIGVKTDKLPATKTNIPKLIFEDQCCYDIIITAWRKARKITKKKYMPYMSGSKLSIREKGASSDIALSQSKDITSASYGDTLDNMVNVVKIYNDKRKMLGEVKNKTHVKKYGVYQQTYTKEKGVNSKDAAKELLVGIKKEATVEAIGKLGAISGKSIKISDKAVGLTGKFYIAEDTHTFENGTHMMTLNLVWDNAMEEGADVTKDESKKKKAEKK